MEIQPATGGAGGGFAPAPGVVIPADLPGERLVRALPAGSGAHGCLNHVNEQPESLSLQVSGGCSCRPLR